MGQNHIFLVQVPPSELKFPANDISDTAYLRKDTKNGVVSYLYHFNTFQKDERVTMHDSFGIYLINLSRQS